MKQRSIAYTGSGELDAVVITALGISKKATVIGRTIGVNQKNDEEYPNCLIRSIFLF